ncbi:MAG: hypothetical protein AB8G14_02205 [Ilumatobacter sp.]
MSRQRGADLALDVDEVVIRREELDALRDDLYVLTTALEDAQRDLAAVGAPTNRELRDALDLIVSAATPLQGRQIQASRDSS